MIRAPVIWTCVTAIGFALLVHGGQPERLLAESCALSLQHAGITFPLDRLDPAWACRIQPVIANYTTANKVGPVRTPLPEAAYMKLLDHPPVAATLVQRLGLAPYRADAKGPDRFWGNDGEGTEGLVHLLYQDRGARVYYLEGFHSAALLPQLSGKAVILVRMQPSNDATGRESVDTTLVTYIRLDSRVLSGLLSLMRPLIGGAVTRKLMRAIETANRLSQEMRQHPDRVVRITTTAPALPSDDAAVVREVLAILHGPDGEGSRKTVDP
jgi:hypothetical protein